MIFFDGYESAVVYGRVFDKRKIIYHLLSDNASRKQLSVTWIVGMPGIGKTTLAGLVYHDHEVSQHFEFKAWLCFSEGFDMSWAKRAIIESVTSRPSVTVERLSFGNMLKEYLRGRRFLIILDDVCVDNKIDQNWDIFLSDFEDVASQICLIVTTGSFVFAAQKSINDFYVNMNPLSEEDGWPMLAEFALKYQNDDSYLKLEAIGRKILRQCNGLPLEVRTLAALLRCKPQVEEWKDVLERLECYSFPSFSGSSYNTKLLLKLSYDYHLARRKFTLKLSYDNLPAHLKACFAYCSIFPPGYEFVKEKLVLLWMAEGLLQPQGGNRTMEEVGNRYFNELVSRQFFQVAINHVM